MSQPERKAPTGTISGECLKTDWWTPTRLLAAVGGYWGGSRRIPFDPATHPSNPTKALRFCAPATRFDLFPRGANMGEWLGRDGLTLSWVKHAGAKAFVNPPYGKELKPWLLKIRQEAESGCEIVALLGCSRWEQRYLTELLDEANALCFVRKRVSFINPATGEKVGGNPYASMFVGFNVHLTRWRKAFEPLGACYELRVL